MKVFKGFEGVLVYFDVKKCRFKRENVLFFCKINSLVV